MTSGQTPKPVCGQAFGNRSPGRRWLATASDSNHLPLRMAGLGAEPLAWALSLSWNTAAVGTRVVGERYIRLVSCLTCVRTAETQRGGLRTTTAVPTDRTPDDVCLSLPCLPPLPTPPSPLNCLLRETMSCHKAKLAPGPFIHCVNFIRCSP